MGVIEFFCRFVKDYAKIAKPLIDLTKKDQKFIWREEQQEAFEELKRSLTSYPILRLPNFDEKFSLVCDASDYGLGAVLHNGDPKEGKVVAYGSRILRKNELKFSTFQKEILAIVFGVTKFRPYNYGRKFDIYSDHKPLVYLYNSVKPELRAHNLKTKLIGYDFNIIHIPGEKK